MNKCLFVAKMYCIQSHNVKDEKCEDVQEQPASMTTAGPFYDVRNLPLEVLIEDSHLMPLTFYQVCYCP